MTLFVTTVHALLNPNIVFVSTRRWASLCFKCEYKIKQVEIKK